MKVHVVTLQHKYYERCSVVVFVTKNAQEAFTVFRTLYRKSETRRLVVRTFVNDQMFQNRLVNPGSMIYNDYVPGKSVTSFNTKYAITLDSANMTARERCAMENLNPIEGKANERTQTILKMAYTSILF